MVDYPKIIPLTALNSEQRMAFDANGVLEVEVGMYLPFAETRDGETWLRYYGDGEEPEIPFVKETDNAVAASAETPSDGVWKCRT